MRKPPNIAFILVDDLRYDTAFIGKCHMGGEGDEPSAASTTGSFSAGRDSISPKVRALSTSMAGVRRSPAT